MRIAIAAKSVDPVEGGAEGYVVGLARGLVARGHTVTLFSAKRPSLDPGIEYRWLETPERPRFLREMLFARHVQEVLKAESFDVSLGMGKTFGCDVQRIGGGLHSTWFEQDLAAFSSRFASLLRRMARVVSLKQRVSFRLDREMYARPELRRVITNSEWVRQDILRRRHLPPERVVCIYNGVDQERFHPGLRETMGQEIRKEHGIGTGQTLLLFAANNYRLKGLPVLMKALVRLAESSPIFDWKLMVAGKGHVSMPWSLKHRVIQVGPRRDLERYYAAADVLVHPTFYDPCANVCLEAMAAGVPVLTTDWNGASELIHSGQEGFIYHNPADVAALSDALLAFSDRNRREAMRVKARKAVERLTPENHLARVEALLLDVVREKQSSPVPPSQKELP